MNAIHCHFCPRVYFGEVGWELIAHGEFICPTCSAAPFFNGPGD